MRPARKCPRKALSGKVRLNGREKKDTSAGPWGLYTDDGDTYTTPVGKYETNAFGLYDLAGNVWEWTASTFEPYPGFVIDPYDTYSAPSFGQQKVLRGGCWATRSRVIRNTWRNFYTPDRRDVWAGFRTCAK